MQLKVSARDLKLLRCLNAILFPKLSEFNRSIILVTICSMHIQTNSRHNIDIKCTICMIIIHSDK